MSDLKDKNAQYFLNLIQKSKRGKFKIYIGMSAGVGKTYRMLQEAHSLVKNNIDIQIAFIETHQRAETQALLAGLPIIPMRKLFYKGKELIEMDVPLILSLQPEVVIIDELAHSNIQGSKNEKRWQDVMDILNAGINVISAVNIQHLESLNFQVKKITQIEVQERIPDSVLLQADEIVNIDLTADELINRLKEGKIYPADKIEIALKNFFQSEHILQLRELALKEVASHVERKVDKEVNVNQHIQHERFMACISSNEKSAKTVIRKTARLANYYQSKWLVLYVQTPKENAQNIDSQKQRRLINNFNLAKELGAEIIKIKHPSIVDSIYSAAETRNISTICMGKPKLNFFNRIFLTHLFHKLLKKSTEKQLDIIILS